MNSEGVKQLAWRICCLFLVGVVFSIMLDFFQIQYRFSAFERNLLGSSFISSPWWVPFLIGAAAVFVGILYPFVDQQVSTFRLGGCDNLKSNSDIQELGSDHWSTILKCLALFIGINQASAKIEFSSDTQLSISLLLLSLSLWWLCDRTHSGFCLGAINSLIATMVAHILVSNNIGRFNERDLSFVRSWLPCVFFSGGITVGNIGRQLMGSTLAQRQAVKHHTD